MPLIETDAPLDESVAGDAWHKQWIGEIDRSEKHFEAWRERAENILKIFRDDRKNIRGLDPSGRRYNILWANTKLLQPMLYAKMPEPEVSRRHKDKDTIARMAADVIKRALRFDMEEDDFDATMKQARDDYLLVGRGTAWCHYLPQFGDEEITPDKLYCDDENEAKHAARENGVADVFFDQEKDKFYVQPDPFRPVVDEACPTEHVLWSEYLHTVTEKWERVWWVARPHLLSRAELKEWFGDDVAKEVECDVDEQGNEIEGRYATSDRAKKARIYEVWDKKTRTVQWISRRYTRGPVARVTDPLGLKRFFPCPRPLWATITTDNMVPLPDYAMYQDQAEELNRLTNRIAALQRAVRVVGVYNAEASEVSRLLSDTVDNDMIPVKNWMIFAEKGGIANQIDWFPFEKVIQALNELYKAREIVKQELFEISGLSDILRGASDPRETLGAQQMKGNFAAKRLVDRQQEVAEFARELIQIKAEIICNKFSDTTLRLQSGFDVMTGIPPAGPEREAVWAQIVALLRDNLLRGFRIDVETDSTVQPNIEQDRAQRIEYVGAISEFMANALPAAQQFPEIGPFLGELALFGTRGWPNASGIESVLEDALDRMAGAQQAAQQQEQPDPSTEIDQARLQQEAQKAQADQQTRMAEIQARQQTEMAKIEFDRWKAEGDWQYKSRELDLKEYELRLKEAEIGLKGEANQTNDRAVDAEIALDAAALTQGATRPNGEINGIV